MRDWRAAVRARLTSLRLSPTREAEIVDELSQHLDDRYHELLGLGSSPDDAARMALRELGDGERLAQHMKALRQARTPAPETPPSGTGRWNVWEELRHVTRTSFRALRRESGFAVASILILALALAVNATAFRVMEATLFHGFPLVKQNERMVFIDERFPYPGCCVSYADFNAWRTEARSFQGLTFSVFRQLAISDDTGEDQDASVCVLSANAFGVLGVAPRLGREFRSSDETPGAAAVIIVSHRYWTARWGGRPDVIGGTVHVNGVPATVVGVMPPGFNFPQRTDLWMPLERTADLYRTVANGSFVFGRLADGVSEAAARAEVEAINRRLAVESPTTNRDVYPAVRNFIDALAGSNATLLYGSVWAGAWLVLVIACANVANLTLARTQRRTREMSTRMALGAGRGRLMLQWLVESVWLTGIAAGVSWWITSWSTRVWTAATDTPYQLRDYTPNSLTLAYLGAVALGAAFVIALVPIARLWRLDFCSGLSRETQGATMTLRARRLSAMLVAGQTMLAIVLMSGAGVLAHSVWTVLRADLGIRSPENVLIGRVALPKATYPTPESRVAFFESLRGRLAGTPGVTSVAIADGRPADDHEPQAIEVADKAGVRGAPVFAAGPGYFQTVGAPLFDGREFTPGDTATTVPVAIVNRSFAETHFPGQSAIGRRIRIHRTQGSAPDEWRAIVGVVSNVMQNDAFRRRFHPAVYVPFAQTPANYGWFFVRAPELSDGLVATIRRAAEEPDPKLEILDVATLKSTVGFGLRAQSGGPGSAEYESLSRHAAVAPVFAAIALLLATIGLYAVVARSVEQRTKEIGVRMTLGAGASDIQRLVLGEGMAPVAGGLLIGLAVSLGVNRVLQSQLVGVSPYDALTLTLAPMILTAVALCGCVVPLVRALRVDPAVALRRD